MNTTPEKGGRMDKVIFYQIKQEDFEKLEKLVEEIYNTIVVVDYFCKNQDEIEELRNITPVIKEIRHKADILYAFFINYSDTLDE